MKNDSSNTYMTFDEVGDGVKIIYQYVKSPPLFDGMGIILAHSKAILPTKDFKEMCERLAEYGTDKTQKEIQDVKDLLTERLHW